jgi:hypothetical protein
MFTLHYIILNADSSLHNIDKDILVLSSHKERVKKTDMFLMILP